MATRLADVEVFEPTRLRYSKVRGGKSFPAPVLLHVGETQQQLEALFADVFVYRSGESTENLITALSHEGMALDQAILRYIPIDEL